MEKKIVIIGAGPTGLGAAYRLSELGYKNWEIYEANDYIGGLAASFKDKAGFTWDIGGHIIFSNYDYFNNLLKNLLGDDFLGHNRKSYIWIENRFVAYPLQNNIKDLSKETMVESIMGLITSQKEKKKPKNFQEWIFATFGRGLANNFMVPYNKKVWAFPLSKLSKDWIAERVSKVNVKKLIENIFYNRVDDQWGPNDKFVYPLKGGTGGLFSKFTPFISDKLFLNRRLTGVDIEKKKLEFNYSIKVDYDVLISTIPLDKFIKSAKIGELYKEAALLKHTGILVVGIGLKKKTPSDKCWIYFPENNCPFYRVTYLSNYSPLNAPGEDFYSLMCETSYSEYKKVDKKGIIEQTIQGLINTKMISDEDKKNIVSRYLIDKEYSYPIPTIDRDKALRSINLFLESKNIYSRGRFGSWKYEIGNMDHSVMQGIDIVNKLVLGEPEKVR